MTMKNLQTKQYTKQQVLVFLFCFAAILLTTQMAPAAQTQDIGLMTRLSGKVEYWNKNSGSTNHNPAQAFMKIHLHDHFKLDPDAVVQIVFFGNGRKETWKGPLIIKTDENQCQPLEHEKDMANVLQLASLPEAVRNEMRKIAPMLDASRLQRAGVSQIRGERKDRQLPLHPVQLNSDDNKAITLAKKTYQSLLSVVGKEDITPELYLFSVLADFDQTTEMRDLLVTMRNKQPHNAAAERLEIWLQQQGL